MASVHIRGTYQSGKWKCKVEQPKSEVCSDHYNYMITITSLSDTLLLTIASYLNPPEMYNLAQSCKRFEMPSTELSALHLLSGPKKKPAENSRKNVVKSVASRLIQESLLHGVANVIQRAINSLSKGKKIVEFQEKELDLGRKVLLSGSAAVQIATGKQFDNFDLNFYCNRQSVPGFRQLMRDCGFCCMGIRPSPIPYCHHTDTPRTIHHIEIFVPSSGIETVPIKKVTSEYYRAWNAHAAAAENDDEVPRDLENPSFDFMNHRNLLLHKFQRHGQRFPRDYPIALTPQHNFTTREHDENDDQNGGSIQLAVCTTCPTQAIRQFDMEILKTARNVDSQTQLAVLGTNNFRMLYGGGDGHLDYTPRYFLGLHNNLMRLLRRALRYIQRGIHVPLSDNVKVLLDCTITQSVKRARLKY
eukprot:scaffold4887_cov153-Skeletonema_menzelii.AAC.3